MSKKQHNETRKIKMQGKSVEELKKIIDSGSLSSAAAQYEMNKRTKSK